MLEDLQDLCECGVEIPACGTCLGHHGLKKKIAVGNMSNMYTIVKMMLRGGKVASL